MAPPSAFDRLCTFRRCFSVLIVSPSRRCSVTLISNGLLLTIISSCLLRLLLLHLSTRPFRYPISACSLSSFDRQNSHSFGVSFSVSLLELDYRYGKSFRVPTLFNQHPSSPLRAPGRQHFSKFWLPTAVVVLQPPLCESQRLSWLELSDGLLSVAILTYCNSLHFTPFAFAHRDPNSGPLEIALYIQRSRVRQTCLSTTIRRGPSKAVRLRGNSRSHPPAPAPHLRRAMNRQHSCHRLKRLTRLWMI